MNSTNCRIGLFRCGRWTVPNRQDAMIAPDSWGNSYELSRRNFGHFVGSPAETDRLALKKTGVRPIIELGTAFRQHRGPQTYPNGRRF